MVRVATVVAWTELNSTGLLSLFDDTDRRTLLEYYATRLRTAEALARIESRSRDPWYDALYPLGLMDGTLEPLEVREFVDSPERPGLILALGAYHNLSGAFLGDLLQAASDALGALGS